MILCNEEKSIIMIYLLSNKGFEKNSEAMESLTLKTSIYEKIKNQC